MHLKYKIAFWLWVVFTMCLIGAGFTATKAHAEEHFAQIHCEATDLDFYKSEHGVMFATVKGEQGNFMYIPAENQRVMFFMNIDTGKMLELGTNAQDRDYIMVYRSAEHAEAHKPELTSRCFKTPRYK